MRTPRTSRSTRLGRWILVTAMLAAVAMVTQLGTAFATNLPQIFYKVNSLPLSYTPRWDAASAPLGLTANPEVVLFGGAPAKLGESWYNDTFLYSNGSWSKGPSAPAGLTPRGGSAMAWDPAIGKIVLFGGGGPTWPPYKDTWLFDGTSWTQGPAAPAGMDPRTGAEMVYDDAIGKVVLFGGSGYGIYNDTWLFDGNGWTAGPTAPAGMLPRAFFGMTYDPVLGQVVVGGGDGSNDVWLFDGNRWTAGPSLPNSTIGARERTRIAYDPQLGGDVLFGGIGPGSSDNVLYLLKGGAWSAVTMHPSPKPIARLDPQLVWDPVKEAFMIFGGVQDATNGTVGLSDTWLVDAPPMSISPTSGVVGTQVQITSGPGWPAGTSVTVSFQTSTLGTVYASSGGYVNTTATVPSTKVGVKTFKLTSSTLQMVESASFTVTHLDAAPTGHSGHHRRRHALVAGAGPASAASPQYRRTPMTATGQITAHGGQFWLGSSPILLHGLDASPIVPDMVDSDFALIQSWHMNFLRLRIRWSDFEPVAPVLNGNTWTHTYSATMMSRLKTTIALAAAHGEYVLIENYCGPPCMGSGMGWPSWLYKSPYNSHGLNYTNVQTANTDFWTDSLQQQFVKSWLVWMAGQLQGVPGVAGYEVLNEPAQGTYPDSLSTTQMMLNVQLQLAQAVRAADPPRMIFFMTRQAAGQGLPDADLSGWMNLGNVAYDVHDYFGGRWGGGLRVANPETLQDLYDFTLTPTNPPYLGTTLSQTFFMQTFQNVLTPDGIPLFLGELGGRGEAEANILTLYATMLDGANLKGVSWTAQSYNGNNDVFTSSGGLEPWVPILSAAAQYPN